MMAHKAKSYTYILFAFYMGLAGFLSLTIHQEISSLLAPTLYLFFVLALTFFIVKRIMGESNLLLSLVSFMVILGWLILIRLQPQLAYKHLLWIALGCLIMVVLLKLLSFLPHDFILKYKFYWLFLTLLLLFLPLVFGIRVGGAKSWLDFGWVRFQTSEVAKLSFLVFLASWFKECPYGSLKKDWPVWGGTLATIAFLVFQRDLGTALVFYLTFLALLYLASGKLKSTNLGLVILIVGAIIAYCYFPHVQMRAQGWLNPWLEPERGGYQILQSLFALSSGGITGMGLGRGNPNMIPEAHTDFVFAVIGEQLGILGTTGVVLLFLFFTFFSLQRARLIPTPGSRFLAAGISFMIMIQAFVIMGGVTKLTPLTGLPLPFMSYGGSSTVISFCMLGLIIWLGREKGMVLASTRKRFIQINKFIWLLFLPLLLNLFYLQVIKSQFLYENPLNPPWKQIEKQEIEWLVLHD